MVSRRRFTFWIGFGLFTLSERLNLAGLDRLAAAAMSGGEPLHAALPKLDAKLPVHWHAAGNSAWQWFERETLINGKWTLSGITTPRSKSNGEHYADQEGYLDESLAPQALRLANTEPDAEAVVLAAIKHSDHHATETRRSRHGLPPSRWLRSLHADELRLWLRTITVPEATVSGMTNWEHLTRDHMFDPALIEGLVEDEQAKLHAAAHFGF